MAVNEGAMNAAANCRSVVRDEFRMGWIGSVVKRNSVLAAGSALARDYENLAVRRGADVIDQPRINFNFVGELWIRRIGNIVNEKVIRNSRKVSVVPDNPFFRSLHILELDSSD